ncbi:hypothetical protein GCM10010387_61610 [Streptomyces inusitatus]|uniref:Ferredoxin n=1 Tax=Streptomyces inusitatus TaxID=68221 RepID=A0A918V2P7_9ACTN|nr:ferredoxin [Streptomyces inusitatus]GGZ59546.1 hypothetical protein GCM10010387_61610 [Streptomyces inusitatus]
MRVEVDRDVCVGAGLCVLTAPEVFAQDDDGLSGLLPGAGGRFGAEVREAARLCPVRAISAVREEGPEGP